MFENIVIGNTIVDPERLFANSHEDWEHNEKEKNIFTNTRYLPAVLKEAGIVNSISEVRRNRQDLVRVLSQMDFFRVKWGKRFLYIAVGE